MADSEEIRRPRPIGVADESDEDDIDMEQTEDRTAVGQGAENNSTPAAATEDAAGGASKKAPSKKRPAFSENNLVMKKGLIQIYNDFPQKCQYKGRGREVSLVVYSTTVALIVPGMRVSIVHKRLCHRFFYTVQQ